ncbi:MAG: glycosyltransferase family 2 protein [Alphaproteobacteria bacterium]|nr:glycosyltransferase family 2 protein [Alphaproteobacteria bacterium]
MTRTAVLIPCFNEEAAIAKVITDFRMALPMADIYVFDNNSTDRTIEAAKHAGAIVRIEKLQGKGNVVRRMFADVEADIYVLVDGDSTYDASVAPSMIDLLSRNSLDMVNGSRVSVGNAAYRRGHKFGNKMLTGMVSWIFGNRFIDILSGYKVLSRRFVKSFPALSSGFEIETELTVHALELNMPIAEVETAYKERPLGSSSKLSTFKDGFRILWVILVLAKEERPMYFFLLLAVLFSTLSAVIVIPIIIEFLETGLVPRMPSAALSLGLMIVAFLALTCGMILETVTRGRKELKRLRYLDIPAPQSLESGR